MLAKTLFCDEQDFLSTLRSLREFDQGYPEVPVLCLAWVGLTLGETLALKDTQVNLDALKIYGADGSILASGFSDAICDALSQYVCCKVGEREHPRAGVVLRYKDFSVPQFIKPFRSKRSKNLGKPYDKQRINIDLSKLNRRYQENGGANRIRYNNAMESGCYYRLYRIERAGVDVTAPEHRYLFDEVFHFYYKSQKNNVHMYKEYKRAFALPSKQP